MPRPTRATRAKEEETKKAEEEAKATSTEEAPKTKGDEAPPGPEAQVDAEVKPKQADSEVVEATGKDVETGKEEGNIQETVPEKVKDKPKESETLIAEDKKNEGESEKVPGRKAKEEAVPEAEADPSKIGVEKESKGDEAKPAEKENEKPKEEEGNEKGNDKTPRKEKLKRPQDVTTVVTRNGKTWNEMFDALVEYKNAKGDCYVPDRYKNDEDVCLGLWVRNQRRRKDSLTEEQRNRLTDLGLDWHTQNERFEETWHERFARLTEYRLVHGDCKVPYTYKDDPALAKWVSQQRAQQAQGRLASDRKAKLDAIDFAWKINTVQNRNTKTEDNKWQKQYEKLVAFHSENGHCRVPDRYAKDRPLGTWVKKQRLAYACGQLKEDRKELLNKLGFVWRITDKTDGEKWDNMFLKLKEYKQEHGTTHISRTISEKDLKPLARWVKTQRALYKANKILPDRKARLESIDFIWDGTQVPLKRKRKRAENEDGEPKVKKTRASAKSDNAKKPPAKKAAQKKTEVAKDDAKESGDAKDNKKTEVDDTKKPAAKKQVGTTKGDKETEDNAKQPASKKTRGASKDDKESEGDVVKKPAAKETKGAKVDTKADEGDTKMPASKKRKTAEVDKEPEDDDAKKLVAKAPRRARVAPGTTDSPSNAKPSRMTYPSEQSYANSTTTGSGGRRSSAAKGREMTKKDSIQGRIRVQEKDRADAKENADAEEREEATSNAKAKTSKAEPKTTPNDKKAETETPSRRSKRTRAETEEKEEAASKAKTKTSSGKGEIAEPASSAAKKKDDAEAETPARERRGKRAKVTPKKAETPKSEEKESPSPRRSHRTRP